MFLVSRGRVSQSLYGDRPEPARKRCQRGCKILLFTDRKSHTGFPLVPKMVTSNDPERCNGRYFAEFGMVLGQLRQTRLLTLCAAISSIAQLL